MAAHELGPDPSLMIDVFTHEAAPVLTIDPGDRIVTTTFDAFGHLERPAAPGATTPHVFAERRGHCLVGPIAVRGARPGQLLGVRFESLRPDVWGWTRAGGQHNLLNEMVDTASGDPAWLLWKLSEGSGIDQHGIHVPLAPFLGVTGVAPAEAGTHSTIPPRPRSGGNIDCRELVAGTTLYLPVCVPGALLFLGDGHAAQGDGEAGGTAIECGMTTEVTVTLHEAPVLDAVHAVTPTHRITFGFDADLNRATGEALAAMLTWMQSLFGVDRSTALALAGTVVDLRVTQVANETWGVHALLPLSVARSVQ